MLTFVQFERELTSERKDKKLVINKKEAEIVRSIFETVEKGQESSCPFLFFKRRCIIKNDQKIF